MELLNEFLVIVLGGGIATVLLWLCTDDDLPPTIVDVKTLDINGDLITVETRSDGISRVVAYKAAEFTGEPATEANGRLAEFWRDADISTLRRMAK